MLSFPLLCRSRSFDVPAKVTLTCFFALVGLAVFVLGTALSPAQAQYPGGYPGTTGTGHYDVSYAVTAGSGSTATYTTSGYPGSGASVSGTDSNSCYTSYGSSPTTYHIAANSALTATFTWNNENNPANLPPSCAIINQGSSASWSAQAQGCVPTGDCDPGLPNPVYTSGYLSKSGTATLYTVKSGSGGLSSITLAPVTPTASSDGTSGSAGGSGANGTVNVSYTASAHPVTINLSGATFANGLQEALTGQQITATLNAPFQVDPNSYSWSASGSMFKNYDWTLASNQKTELTDADYFRSSFTFYDATAETVTPDCSATVVCPDGTRLSVNVQQPIMVLKPTETAWTISAANAPDGGYFYDYPDNVHFNPQYGVQTTWSPITMTVPRPFTGGQVCLAQIGNFNRTDTRVALNGASNTYVVTPATQGLDTGFPYLIAYQVDGNGNIITGNNGSDTPLSPPQWSISGSGPSYGAGGDRPTISCEPPLVNRDTGGQDWRSSTDTDQFDTWTMYRPPSVGGQPTVWVPVQTIHWAWSGSANVHTDAGGNVITHPDGNAQWYYTIPQVSPAGNPTNTTAFPTWTAVIPYGLTMGPPAAH